MQDKKGQKENKITVPFLLEKKITRKISHRHKVIENNYYITASELSWIIRITRNIQRIHKYKRTKNKNSPEVASRLWRMQVSTPSSKSNIKTIAAVRCAETCSIPIITRFFRDTLDGTNEIAAMSSSKVPAKDT